MEWQGQWLVLARAQAATGCRSQPSAPFHPHPHKGSFFPKHSNSLLVNLLGFLLDLGLISVLQVLTGFPESQVLPCRSTQMKARQEVSGEKRR